jgi:hypothetical protein
MKKTAQTGTRSTDGIYSVSAADLADKLIHRMSEGLDPWLFPRSTMTQIRVSPLQRTWFRNKAQ